MVWWVALGGEGSVFFFLLANVGKMWEVESMVLGEYELHRLALSKIL